MARGTFQDCCCQCPHPCSEHLLTHASTGDPPTLTGSFGSVFNGVTAPFLWVFVHTRFCLCPSRLESHFPQSCGSPIIKFCWPSASYSRRIPSPFIESLGKHDIGIQTLTAVWELLWYYCSPICGSLTRLVWDLILSWLYPSYHLTAASLSLDIGYLFWWIPASFCQWLFNSYLWFWCFCRWAHYLLLCHLELEDFLCFNWSIVDLMLC